MHARLRHALHNAQGKKRSIMVDDVSKAFDHVHLGQALAILLSVGIALSLLCLIFVLYLQLRRVFQLDGCITSQWYCGKHGIAQGCPCSPMLLAAIMFLWSRYFERHCGLPHGVYVDDRCWWDSGPRAAHNVAAARAVAVIPDRVFGFVLTSKAQALGTSAATRATLRSLRPDTIPVVL
ncbi:MAG: reverse transcriptase domain-containing protein, partial [Candidatus Fonsibacter sp.]